ncbi:thioredoxin-like protein [Dacryopinax primogenitus]|uniref:Thioredoxin-like protein n=1 Tax=Dacryopinax primogenitus (strain DJM 731) TaxID=1858805 RepID=M5GBV2_DACPD|nr:thioredoxin-like protein [Dacryopinax primogenitus]EJU06474.1 thioredoxin-like protein [Dacryopinax primogenitus]
MEELKRDLERTRAQDEVHGRYTELTEEKDVIQTSAKEPLCVIHFYHRDFRRCKIMDSHLEALAPNYPGTRFLRVLVENVPFLVDRLQIKVLPCVVCFVKGVTKDRLVGFEQLGNADEFETGVLELRLKQSGVIEDAPRVPLRTRYSEPERRSGIRNSCLGDEDDDPYA